MTSSSRLERHLVMITGAALLAAAAYFVSDNAVSLAGLEDRPVPPTEPVSDPSDEDKGESVAVAAAR